MMIWFLYLKNTHLAVVLTDPINVITRIDLTVEAGDTREIIVDQATPAETGVATISSQEGTQTMTEAVKAAEVVTSKVEEQARQATVQA